VKETVMNLFNKDLKMYAENGLRSAVDWLTLGREVENGLKPRANVDCRGVSVELFTKDQTQPREQHR
jgi:hypothetical protein